MEARWTIQLFNQLQVSYPERESVRFSLRKSASLLAYLAYYPQRAHPREILMEMLWPEAELQSGRNRLNLTLSMLRQALPASETGVELLLSDRFTVQINPQVITTDVARFEAFLLAAAQAAGTAEQPARLKAAVAAYGGELLPGFYEAWIGPERLRLDERYQAALQQLLRQQEAAGDLEGALDMALRLLAADPEEGEGAAEVARLQCLSRRGVVPASLNSLARRPSPAARNRAESSRPSVAPSEAPLRTPPAPLDRPHNLPRQLTSFIGRAKEIAEVTALLDHTALLTLTGSGGCGKTRLSLQVASSVREQFPDGVWLVELAALSDPGLAPQTVASTWGLVEQPGKSFTQTLTEYLQSKNLLLVLDNCEHLLLACAQLSEALLRACAHVKILASSRERLGIGGELIYRVPSLSLPDLQSPLTVERVSRCEAGQLFVERALFQRPGFAVTSQNAPALGHICHRLDGIPLAIELAAARVRSLSVEEINSRLGKCFRLLTGGSATTLPRQQTLVATINWSYDLLTPAERLLLARLSVFVGGWTLETAEQVCQGESPTGAHIAEGEVLNLLAGLVDKSLVLAETHGQATRYRLLETVRQYALERLEASAESQAVRGRHRDTFLALAEEANPELTGSQQAYWLSVLEEEHDNLRQALAFCGEETAGDEKRLSLGAALFRFWNIRGHWSEGRERLTAALSRPGGQVHAKARADALNGVGVLALSQGDYAPARSLLEESLAIYRELGDAEGIAFSVNNLGRVACCQGDMASARSLFEESLAIYRELGDQGSVAHVLSYLGHVDTCQGDYALARSLLEESLTIGRKLGNKGSIAFSLSYLGIVAHEQRDYALAHILLEESLTIYRELGDKGGIARVLSNLGRAAYFEGDYDSARSLTEEILLLQRELGDRRGIANYLEMLALLACKQNRSQRSARLWGAVAVMYEALGLPLSEGEEQVRESLGEAAFSAAFEEGRAMTLEQALDYALGE
jgi:predicted ATPase/DNA-binding SARP family transcriptional activator